MAQLEELEKLVQGKEEQRKTEMGTLQGAVEGKESDAAAFAGEPQSQLVRKPLAVAQGFKQGPATVLGAPVDILSSGLGLLGLAGDQPVLGSDWIMQNIMPEDAMEERGLTEKGLSRIGEEIGAAILPYGAVVNRIKKGVGLIQAGYKSRGIISQMVEDLSKLPIGQLTKLEARAAAGAGAGGFVAEEAFPDNPTAQMIGQLAGSIGPEGVANLLRLARRKAMKVVPALTKEGVKERVAKTLDNMAKDSPDFEKQLETSIELQEEFPEMQLTLPEATMSSEAVYLQKRLGQVAPGLADEVAMHQGLRNKEMRSALGNSLRIGLHESDQSVMLALRKRMQILDRKLNASIARAEDQINQRAALIKEDLAPEEIGEIIRKELTEKVAKWREQSTILFNGIDPDNVIRLKPEPVVRAIQDIHRTWSDTAEGLQTMPGIIRRVGKLLLDDQAVQAAGGVDQLLGMRDPPVKVISFNKLIKVRSDVLRVKRDISSGFSEYSGLKRRKMNQLIESIEETMAQLVTDPYWGQAAAATVERYRMAAQFYRKGVESFQQGIMGTLQRSSRGELMKSDIQVAGEILKAGKIGQKRGDDFIRALGGNEKAEEAILQYSLNEIYDNATREVAGELTVVPKRMREWLRQHKYALEYFPKVQAELEDITGLEKRLLQLRSRKLQTLDARHEGAIQLFLEGNEPTEVMAGLMKSPKGPIQLKQIVRKIRGDEDAIKGLRKAFFKAMAETFESTAYDRFGNLKVNPRTARRFLDSKKSLLRQLYNSQELKWLDRWVGAQQRMIRAGELTPSEVKINVLDDPWEISKSWILSRWWNVKRRIIGKPYVFSEAIFRLADAKAKRFQREEAVKLLREALFDPKIARDLIQYARAGKQLAVYKRLRAHLANLGGADRFGGELEYDVKITGPVPGEEKEQKK